jgi:predicted metal-binding membrane protein
MNNPAAMGNTAQPSGRALQSVISSIEHLVRRDRLIVALALALITALAWLYLVRMANTMNAAANEAAMHAAMGMSVDTSSWSVAHLTMLLLMWSVIMAGMMLPSSAPVMLLVVGVYRRRGGRAARFSTLLFGAGYLAAWTSFSALAALTQAVLHSLALVSSAMAAQSATLAGALFVAAGIYQWLPLKNACLSYCRSPLRYLSDEWREGLAGAFLMGFRHGLFCVGCCWALMALLFAAGVMNLLWVAAIASFVLIEKLLPRAARASAR